MVHCAVRWANLYHSTCQDHGMARDLMETTEMLSKKEAFTLSASCVRFHPNVLMRSCIISSPVTDSGTSPTVVIESWR